MHWKEEKRGWGKVSESIYRFPDSRSFLERIKLHARSLEYEYKRGGRVPSVMLFHEVSRSSGTDCTARREGKQEGHEGEKTRSRTRRCEEGTPQRGNWRTELMHTKRHARNVIIANLWTQSRDSHTTRDCASAGPRFHRWNYSCYSPLSCRTGIADTLPRKRPGQRRVLSRLYNNSHAFPPSRTTPYLRYAPDAA